jgi:hypothetical protein
MTIVYDRLLSLDIPQVVQTYSEKDAILYALGLGLGHDPLNADELPFVYEKSIKLLPTFAVALGWPGFWARDLDSGIDWVKLVAGEQGLKLHRPLSPRGTVVGKTLTRRAASGSRPQPKPRSAAAMAASAARRVNRRRCIRSRSAHLMRRATCRRARRLR